MAFNDATLRQNNSGAEQQQSQNPGDTRIVLDIDPKIPFDASYDGKYISNTSLAEIVNSCFSTIPEFKGSIVEVNPTNGEITATLYFRPLHDDSGIFVKNAISNSPAQDITSRLTNMSARTRSKTIVYTKELSEILLPFIPNKTYGLMGVSYNNEVNDISNFTTEVVNELGNNKQEILLQVTSISIDRLLSEYHGNKNANGETLEYKCIFNRYINPGSGSFLVDVKRLNVDDLENVGDMIGINTSTTKSIKIIRAR